MSFLLILKIKKSGSSERFNNSLRSQKVLDGGRICPWWCSRQSVTSCSLHMSVRLLINHFLTNPEALEARNCIYFVTLVLNRYYEGLGHKVNSCSNEQISMSEMLSVLTSELLLSSGGRALTVDLCWTFWNGCGSHYA